MLLYYYYYYFIIENYSYTNYYYDILLQTVTDQAELERIRRRDIYANMGVQIRQVRIFYVVVTPMHSRVPLSLKQRLLLALHFCCTLKIF